MDKLGITSVRLFDNHYKRKDTNNNDKPYGLISLLFSYSPKNSYNPKKEDVKGIEYKETLPELAYGMYNIAVSNDDMIELKKGDDYEYYKVAMIDEFLNVIDINCDENPIGKKPDFFKALVKEKVDSIHKKQVAKMRLAVEINPEFHKLKSADKKAIIKTLETESIDALVEALDLSTVTDVERKGLLRFNPDTAMVQKQGYYAYMKLLINMTNWGITYFNPINVNLKFDAKKWTSLVNGDVTDANKQYNSNDKAFRYLDDKGVGIKDAKPKIWFLAYLKLNSKGYTNQEFLCPSNVGINNTFDATAIEGVNPTLLFGDWVADLKAPTIIKCRINYNNCYKKVFGYEYTSQSFNNDKALIKYPYSFDFMPKDKLVAPTATAVTDTTDLSDDAPF